MNGIAKEFRGFAVAYAIGATGTFIQHSCEWGRRLTREDLPNIIDDLLTHACPAPGEAYTDATHGEWTLIRGGIECHACGSPKASYRPLTEVVCSICVEAHKTMEPLPCTDLCPHCWHCHVAHDKA